MTLPRSRGEKPRTRHNSTIRITDDQIAKAREKARQPRPAIARKSPVKRRNVKRWKANHARAYGEYRDWIVTQPCCACGYAGPEIDPAHSATGGTRRKADAKTLVPLCGPHVDDRDGNGHMMCAEGCHRMSHRIGVQSFQRAFGVDLRAIASRLWDEWKGEGE